jgi:hypothetical protein
MLFDARPSDHQTNMPTFTPLSLKEIRLFGRLSSGVRQRLWLLCALQGATR